MRFTTRLFLLFAGVLMIAIIGTSLALWGAHEARSSMARTELAHRSYESHLSLSNHTYQLFKQFGDAMTIGDQDQGALERELFAAIRQDIAEIRAIIAAEIQLVGDEEVEELEHLARIETQIASLLREYQTVLDTGYASPFRDEWERLSRILDERVDQDFAMLTQSALDEEARELEAQRLLTAGRLRINQLLAVMVAIIGVLAASAALWWLVRDLNAPIGRLIDGAQALAHGDRDHRINIHGCSELDGVARALNHLADEIAAREQMLQISNQRLERAVAERTEELEGLLESLQTAEADRRRFLADVSHELRTPLTIIRGEADIALRGADKPPTDYRLALEKCRDAAQHTARLVDDLLFIARRDSGEVRLKLGPVDLAALLPAVIGDCRSMADGHVATVTFQNILEHAIVRADPDRLRQVLVILLDNALRYGGAAIDVSLRQGTSGYVIAVQDDGPGLNADELGRVFQRFFRGSNAASRYNQGAGLGLPVAKAIVEAHDGEITLASEQGQGLAVTLWLPDRPRLEVVA
jgi:signal transduction histidine kinase